MSDRAVYKSRSVEGLDAFFSGSPEELSSAYEYALKLLQQNQSLSAIITQVEQDRRGPRDADPTSADSPLARVGNLDEVVRSGYTQAIELARARNQPVPIETLWMTGAGNDEFEIHVCDGERQVIVLWLIPVVLEYGSRRASSRSWRVGAGTPPVQKSGPRQGGAPSNRPER